MKRRTFLGVAGLAGSTLTLGCFRVAQDNSDNSETDTDSERTENDENSPRNDEENNDEESLLGGDENDSEPHSEPHNETDTNTTNETNETMNETTNETTDNRQKRPTDDQITPDRSKYNESTTSQRRETESLPPESVSVTSKTKKSGRTYVASGTVTNEIDETIDFVNIDVLWIDSNGTTIGTTGDTVRDIPPGGSKDFRTSVSVVDLKGEPDSIEGEAYPKQYV